MRGEALAVLIVLALAGCDKKAGVGTTSSARSSRPPAPAPPFVPSRPPIRDNSARGEAHDGVVTEVRLLVSTIATGEPLHVALQFRPSVKPARTSPWYREQLDWSEAVLGLVFVVEGPDGKKRELKVAAKEERPVAWPLAGLVQNLSVGDKGLGDREWSEPVAGLFDAPGKYSFSLAGDLKTKDRVITVSSKPVQFEVKQRGDAMKSIDELEALMAKAVAKSHSLSSPPKPSAPTVDDVDGNRWLRFTLRDDQERYDVNVLEVLSDPSGKQLFADEFEHFTCVAEGTRIATPSGPVPVEALRVGDVVVSYDETSHTRTTSTVRGIETAHAEHLQAIGRLRVTGNHPVYADGQWVAARDVRSGAELLTPTGSARATVTAGTAPATVFDIAVGPPHTYFADGVLLHNKAAYVPIGGEQPFSGWFYRRAARAVGH